MQKNFLLFFSLLISCADKGPLTRLPYHSKSLQLSSTKTSVQIKGLRSSKEKITTIDLQIAKDKKEYQLSNGEYEFFLPKNQKFITTVTRSPGHDCQIVENFISKLDGETQNIEILCRPHSLSFSGIVLNLGDLRDSILIKEVISQRVIEITPLLERTGDVPFSFDDFFSYLDSYQFEIFRTPNNLSCSIPNPLKESLASKVENFVINCSPLFTISGVIVGIDSMSKVKISLNGSEKNVVNQSPGLFTFPVPLEPGSSYNVTLLETPEGFDCNPTQWFFSKGENIVQNVTNIEIRCSRKKLNLTVRTLRTIPLFYAVKTKIFFNGEKVVDVSLDYSDLRKTIFLDDILPFNSRIDIVTEHEGFSNCTISLNKEILSQGVAPDRQSWFNYPTLNKDFLIEYECFTDDF